MLFNRNDKITNEKTIYQTKPNMLLGCKKAIFGVILLVVVLLILAVAQFITFVLIKLKIIKYNNFLFTLTTSF